MKSLDLLRMRIHVALSERRSKLLPELRRRHERRPMKIDKYFHLYGRKNDVVFEEVDLESLSIEKTAKPKGDVTSDVFGHCRTVYYCGNCGQGIIPADRYCRNCGYKVRW